MGQTAIGVGITILLARALGPAGFGAVSVALAIAFTVSGLSDWGLSVAFVRLASPEIMAGRSVSHLHSVFLGIRMALALTLAALVASGAGWLTPALQLPADLPWLAAAAALAGVLMAVSNHYTGVLQVARDQRGLALLRTGVALARLTAYAVLALSVGIPLGAALAVTLLAVPVEALATAALAHRRVPLRLVAQRPPRAWVAFSVWAALPTIAYSLIGQSDTMLLAAFAGTGETGQWAAAGRIASVLPMVSGAAWSVALPYATAIVDQRQLDRYVRLVGLGAMALAVATVLAMLLSPLAVAVLYGERYAASVPTLRLLFAAHAVGSLTLLTIPVAYRLGRERLVAVTGLVEFAVNLGGDLLWIPRYGAAGSAAATLAMHLAGLLVLVVPVLRELRRGGPLRPATVTTAAP